MRDSLQNFCENVKLRGQTTTKTWYKHSTGKQEVAKQWNIFAPEGITEYADTTE